MNNHEGFEWLQEFMHRSTQNFSSPLPGKARAFGDWIVQICAPKGQNGTMAHKAGHAANKNDALQTNERYRSVAKSSWFINFRCKAISKWRTDPLRTRHITYISIPIDDFGVGQRHFPLCSQEASRLTYPYTNYLEILTHHYAWSNKEFEEFSITFASSKALCCVRPFGLSTSDARMLIRTCYVAYLRYHPRF